MSKPPRQNCPLASRSLRRGIPGLAGGDLGSPSVEAPRLHGAHEPQDLSPSPRAGEGYPLLHPSPHCLAGLWRPSAPVTPTLTVTATGRGGLTGAWWGQAALPLPFQKRPASPQLLLAGVFSGYQEGSASPTSPPGGLLLEVGKPLGPGVFPHRGLSDFCPDRARHCPPGPLRPSCVCPLCFGSASVDPWPAGALAAGLVSEPGRGRGVENFHTRRSALAAPAASRCRPSTPLPLWVPAPIRVINLAAPRPPDSGLAGPAASSLLSQCGAGDRADPRAWVRGRERG